MSTAGRGGPRVPRWLATGGGILLVLSLGAGLPLAIVYGSQNLRGQAHRFLTAARDGRLSKAHEVMSTRFGGRVPLERLPAYLEQRAPDVLRHESAWTNGMSGSTAEQCLEIWLYGDAVQRGTVYVMMVSEDGEWRVDDVTTVEPGLCD